MNSFFEILMSPSKGVDRYSYKLRIATFFVFAAVLFYKSYETNFPIFNLILLTVLLSYPFIVHFVLKFDDKDNSLGYKIFYLDSFLLAICSGAFDYSYIILSTSFTGVIMNSIFFRGFKNLLFVALSYFFGLLFFYITSDNIFFKFDHFGIEEITLLFFSTAYYIFSAYTIYTSATKFNRSRKDLKLKNNELMDSLRYSKIIQSAFLKNEEHVSKNIPPHFVYLKAKHIVSGDFYWALEKKGYLYVAVGDCTSKDVPGAFLTMLSITFLDHINSSPEILDPNSILDLLHEKFIKELSSNPNTKDEGIEIIVIKLNLKDLSIKIASTSLPFYVIQENKVKVINSVKQPIGKLNTIDKYSSECIQLNEGDSIYLITSGIINDFSKLSLYKNLDFSIFINNELSQYDIYDQKKIFHKLNNDFLKEYNSMNNDWCIIGIKV